MDSAVPAHEIAEAVREPRDSHRETLPLPSLILRLEPLPEATARHERARFSGVPTEAEAARGTEVPTLPPPPAPGTVDHVADDTASHDTASYDTASHDTASYDTASQNAVPAPLFEHRPRPNHGSSRRVVDVAAPERLTVATPLTRWSAAVAASHDGCFVLDTNGILISVSVAATELLGCGELSVIGRHILDVITLVDLDTGGPDPDYAHRITALSVLESPGLSRSLMRVRHDDSTLVTLDTTSAPVHDVTGYPLGSVTFLAPIPRR